MKTKLLLASFLFAVSFCHAQFETGKRVMGGQFAISYYNNGNPSGSAPNILQRNFSIAPSFSLSKFKTPTLLNGFDFSYVYNHSHTNIGSPTDEQVSYSHSFGAFVSTTKLHPLAKKFYLGFTGTGGLAYGFGKSVYSSNIGYSDTRNYNVSASGGLGLFYQLGQRFLLSGTIANLLNLSYNYGTQTNYAGSNIYKSYNSNINLSTGLNGFSTNNFVVGVRYILK